MILKIYVFIIHTCMNKIRIQNPLKSACYSLIKFDNILFLLLSMVFI